MKNKTWVFFFVFSVAVAVLLMSGQVHADKSAVQIKAPSKAAVGDTITIILHVSHSGNNLFHHTDRVVVTINGEEAERWEFGLFSTPDNENFTLTMTHVMDREIDIEAEANCNIHGSAGKATHSVGVTQ